MADTFISNNPSDSDQSGTLGWIVALIVVLAVIIAGFVWVRRDVGIPNTGVDNGASAHMQLPSTDNSPATPQY